MLDLTKVNVYMVGGYVRDRILNQECHDHDFVVVGADHQIMIDAGFSHIEATNFPVYLHPITKDEYALARTETKTGNGYHGFETDFNPSVTLEEDLSRRDLTINAMARKIIGWGELGHAKLSDGVIDPFNGQKDLADGLIRHTSDAFKDDPVRVLRACRFAARYQFEIDAKTWMMMKQMVYGGELDYITPERIWLETSKAMSEDNPMTYFRLLIMSEASTVTIPLLSQCDDESTSDAVTTIAAEYNDLRFRFAALTATLSPIACASFYQSLKAPSNITQFAVKVNWLLRLLESGYPVDGDMNVEIIEKLNGYKNPDIINDLYDIIPFFNDEHQISMLKIHNVASYTRSVSFADLGKDEQESLKGPEIGYAIRDKRVRIANEVLSQLS